MKKLVILISILIINNGFVKKSNPQNNSNDVFYKLILKEIPEKLFINNKVTFKSYAKWKTQLEDICGSRSKFLNDSECQILIKKFSEQDKELNISDSLKSKMNDIAEKLYVNNGKENKVSYLLSNPIFISDDKVVIIKAVFFKKGGGQSAYVFKKENNKWFIDERQGLVDY